MADSRFPFVNLPRGLTGLIGLLTSGMMPRDLAEQIVGTVDLEDYFALNKREGLTGSTGAIATVGATAIAALTVPDRETWLVQTVAMECQPGAGAAIEICPYWSPITGGGTQASLTPYIPLAATQNGRVAYNGPPLLCGPGTTFGVNVKSLTLTPTASVTLFLARLSSV